MTRIWALKGSRPRIVRQQQSLSVYLFGAVCPATDQAVGLVLPYANKEMMAHHLTQISLAVPKGRHAVLVVDQATFHKTDKLICPENISLLFLPLPYAPELNPVENGLFALGEAITSHRLWYLAQSNLCFEGYDAIVSGMSVRDRGMPHTETEATIQHAINAISNCQTEMFSSAQFLMRRTIQS